MTTHSPTITAFEHQTLSVGEVLNGCLFRQEHWETLVQMHTTLPLPYYTLTHRGIKLSYYVGVLVTPSLTLEILPKADAHTSPSLLLWRHCLIDMVAECRLLKPRLPHATVPTFGAGTLLDFFLLDFLAEVDALCRRGLVKQYQVVEENVRSLKGRLLFAQHLRRNTVHQERFFVKHQPYTLQHRFHQLFKHALRIVVRTSQHPLVQQRSRRLLSYFADVADLPRRVLQQPLTYRRQTVAYRTAAEVAQQILAADFSHLYPDTTHRGFALLFDMNRIFEEFVYQRFRRLAGSQGYTVHRQTSRSLWGETQARPDIVVELPAGRGRVVIDTKWKVLTSARPAAADLHQLYVYNQLFGARRGILLYPNVHHFAPQQRRFEGPGDSYAEVHFVTIADEEQKSLNPRLDKWLLSLLS